MCEQYEGWMLYDGWKEKPAFCCATCGRRIADGRRQFYQDTESQLIYCTRKCAALNNRTHAEAQAQYMALLAAKNIGLSD